VFARVTAERLPQVSWVLLIKTSRVLISLRLTSHISNSDRSTCELGYNCRTLTQLVCVCLLLCVFLLSENLAQVRPALSQRDSLITGLTQILEVAQIKWPRYPSPFDILSLKSPNADISMNFSLLDSNLSQGLGDKVRMSAALSKSHHWSNVLPSNGKAH